MLRRSLTLALLCTPLAILGGPGAQATDLPPLEIETYTLDNGLQVILHTDHSTPVVAVNTWYHVGSKNERPGRSGFAHLFEHMMFQGSEHLDQEYFGPLQSIGGQINGSTNQDRTNYWQVVPANHLERVLLMEADRMGWLLPAMTQEKLDNQRDVVRNERRQSEGRPYSAFWLESDRLLYPKGHPYDHSVIGEHEDLEAASLDDVKDFFRQYYTPNNATLCIAGDFDVAQVKEWIAKYYGEIPPGPPVNEVAQWVPEFDREYRFRFEDRVQLPRVYFVWHSAPYFAPGDAELDLAAKALGQGRTSRLYRRLVHELEIAQDVAAFQSSQQLASQFVVQATLKPGVTVEQVQTEIDAVLAEFRETGPTREELKRFQNSFEADFVKGMQRVGSWGGKSDVLNKYNHYVGKPDYFREDLDRYLKASPSSVKAAFDRWIHDRRAVFEIHPMGNFAAAPATDVDRSTLPEGGPRPELVLPALAEGALDNGLETMVMTRSELPLVQVQLVFRTGSASEPLDRNGLADLTTDMLLSGTKKRDKFEFSDELEALGTDLATWTSDDYTVVSMVTLKKHLDASMALLAEAVTEPVFPDDELTREKKRRVLNLEREKENPNQTVVKITRRIVYGADHPYSLNTAGTVSTMEAIERDDVVRRHREHFTPGNAVLIAVGDVTPDEIGTTARKHLGAWQGPAPEVAAIPDPPARTQRTVYLVDKPGDSQSTLSVAHLGVARNSPDWERIYVANRILGGMFTSRLNLNVREDKGYSYGTRTQFSERVHRGAFAMGGRVQTEVTAPAIVEFLKELDGIHGANPITDDELAFAKGSITQNYASEFETNREVVGALAEQVIYGLPADNLTTYPDRIEAVTVEEVNAAGQEYFHPDRVAVIVVGDLAKIEDSIRALDLGPIVHLDAEGHVIDEPGDGTGTEEE